jgi:dephospho-CoA kinase
VVFVKVPLEVRLKRLAQGRGWGAEELSKREKLQFSLDKKAELADYCIDNSGDEASTLRQVQRILSQILALPV